MGPLQLVSHVVQNTFLVSKKRTGARQTKKITILDDVSSLFVLSQCVSCSPARCFCTTWPTSCKGPITCDVLSEPLYLWKRRFTDAVLKIDAPINGLLFPRNIWEKSGSWYFKTSQISLAVFIPDTLRNHAITYPNQSKTLLTISARAIHWRILIHSGNTFISFFVNFFTAVVT